MGLPPVIIVANLPLSIGVAPESINPCLYILSSRFAAHNRRAAAKPAGTQVLERRGETGADGA